MGWQVEEGGQWLDLGDAESREVAALWSNSPTSVGLLQVNGRSFVADLHEATLPSLVLIRPSGVRNATTQGSGFVIGVGERRFILTSAHVCKGGWRLEVALAAYWRAGGLSVREFPRTMLTVARKAPALVPTPSKHRMLPL